MQARFANSLGIAASVVTVVALSACQPRDNEVATTDTGVAAMADTTVRTADTTVVAGALRREYTRENVFGVLQTANAAEIEAGQAAVDMATNPQVKDFARTIVRDHTAAREKVSEVAQQLTVTPAVFGNDDDLIEDHQEAMRDLQGKTKGADWDKAFLDHQIDAHKDIIDEVDDAIESTQEPQIRTLLQEQLTSLRAHLQRAEQLKEQID